MHTLSLNGVFQCCNEFMNTVDVAFSFEFFAAKNHIPTDQNSIYWLKMIYNLQLRVKCHESIHWELKQMSKLCNFCVSHQKKSDTWCLHNVLCQSQIQNTGCCVLIRQIEKKPFTFRFQHKLFVFFVVFFCCCCIFVYSYVCVKISLTLVGLKLREILHWIDNISCHSISNDGW